MSCVNPFDILRRGRFSPVRRLAIVAVAGFLVAACSDSPVVPSGPGSLVVTLESPHGPEGAALLEVSGSSFHSIGSAASQGTLVFVEEMAEEALVVVIREEAGEISFEMEVEDMATPPSIRVLSVVDGDDQLREGMGGYEIRVDRAGGEE